MYLFGVIATTPEKAWRLNAEVPDLFFVPVYDGDAVLILDRFGLLLLLFAFLLTASFALLRNLAAKTNSFF